MPNELQAQLLRIFSELESLARRIDDLGDRLTRVEEVTR